jgi:hypothetical protein
MEQIIQSLAERLFTLFTVFSIYLSKAPEIQAGRQLIKDGFLLPQTEL